MTQETDRTAETAKTAKTDGAPKTAETGKAAARGSALAGGARFVGRHPVGVIQVVFFALLAVVVLQNLEPTTIDVLFWSVPGLPKLVVIFISMLLGAAAWELLRRRLPR